MRALLAAFALGAAACTTTPQPRPASVESDPHAAAASFLDAVEGARWDDAYALLSERWRARLTPARLAADWEQGGARAGDTLARARLALRAPPEEDGAFVAFAIGEGKRLALVREAGGWRIEALE